MNAGALHAARCNKLGGHIDRRGGRSNRGVRRSSYPLPTAFKKGTGRPPGGAIPTTAKGRGLSGTPETQHLSNRMRGTVGGENGTPDSGRACSFIARMARSPARVIGVHRHVRPAWPWPTTLQRTNRHSPRNAHDSRAARERAPATSGRGLVRTGWRANQELSNSATMHCTSRPLTSQSLLQSRSGRP